MNKGVFVTATGTGVGKTVVACGLTRLFSRWKKNIGVMKPFASGDRDDAQRLIKASGQKLALELVNPQFFKQPLAPAVAATLEEKAVHMEAVYAAFWELSKTHELMVVEGVGGVKVPLTESTYVLDLISALRLPALVVAHAGLGTLNHTLLTLDALQHAHVPILGVLLNGDKAETPAEKTNAEALREFTLVPVLGTLPHDPRLAASADLCADALEQCPDLIKALQRLCER